MGMMGYAVKEELITVQVYHYVLQTDSCLNSSLCWSFTHLKILLMRIN